MPDEADDSVAAAVHALAAALEKQGMNPGGATLRLSEPDGEKLATRYKLNRSVDADRRFWIARLGNLAIEWPFREGDNNSRG